MSATSTWARRALSASGGEEPRGSRAAASTSPSSTSAPHRPLATLVAEAVGQLARARA